jgi:hypothetical protein
MPPRKGFSMARSIRSRPLYLLLTLALAASPSLAVVGRQAPAHSTSKSAPSTSWASRTWSALQSLFGRSGAEMDPNGAKAKPTTLPTASTVQPPTSTDLGAEMDPDG